MSNQHRMVDLKEPITTATIKNVRAITAPDEHASLADDDIHNLDSEDAQENPETLEWIVNHRYAYENGDWYYFGLWVECDVFIPMGGRTATSFKLRSPGVWGMESDGFEGDYLKEILDEQSYDLAYMLKALRFTDEEIDAALATINTSAVLP